MKIKLTSFNALYTPDIKVKLEDDSVVNNKDLPVNDRIETEITLASISQKSKYISLHTYSGSEESKSVSNFNYSCCIETHVIKITGLEEYGIKTGKDLIAHAPTIELNELIQDLFMKINGIKSEDALSPKK